VPFTLAGLSGAINSSSMVITDGWRKSRWVRLRWYRSPVRLKD